MKFTSTLLSKPWRDASSLLLCCPIELSGGQKSVAYLVTKRSEKVKFMPGGLSFAGGTTSPADTSSEWIHMYKNAGIHLQNLTLMSKTAHQPPIYTDDISERLKANLLPAEISLRITALRETFEECGLLLTSSSFKSVNSSSINPPQLQNPEELLRWQDKVKENPEEFINLCKNLSVLPDLTALYEWSNWLTPPTFRNPKQRFDTMFYITCVPHQLPISLDKHESDSAEWSTAATLVKGHEEGKHQLLPPQYYEMSRLSNVHSIDDIIKLGNARKEIGFERWLPDVIMTKDGVVSLLPGDELYSKDYDPTQVKLPTPYESTDEELLNSTTRHHRWKFVQGSDNLGVNINIEDRFGQYYSISKLKSSPRRPAHNSML